MAKKKKKKKSNDSVTLLAESLSKVVSDAVQAAVEPLRDDMKEMEVRLNARIDGAVEQLNTRMDGLEKRMDGLEKRMDGLEKRMDGLEERMDGLEKQIQTTNENMSAQFAEQERKIGKLLKNAEDGPDSNGSGGLHPPTKHP